MKRLLCLSLLMISTLAHAQSENLGTWGQAYPIAEPDMLNFIHMRLETLQKDGELAKMEAQFQERVKEHVLRPTPVAGVSNATENKTFYYEPTFTLQQNVYGSDGSLIYKRGTTINPLDLQTVEALYPNAYVPPFNEILLFINADDQRQVAWAKAETSKEAQVKNSMPVIIILVRGDIKEAGDALGRIYFDQNGVICHKFNIHAVPAMVHRVGTRLEIQEIALNGNSPESTQSDASSLTQKGA